MFPTLRASLFALAALAAAALASCGRAEKVQAKAGEESPSGGVSVGVVKVQRKSLGRTLTVSSELVPFQQIDVYAKESGYVKQLNVDYGSRVQKDQIMATLEIPELQLQVKEDEAAIKNATAQIPHAQDELNRTEAQHNVLQLQFERLDSVSKSIGMVGAFMELLHATLPKLTRWLEHSFSKGQIDELYGQIQSVDFSRAVLTQMPGRLVVLRDAAAGWTDFGSPRRAIDVLLSQGIRPSWLTRQHADSMKAFPNGVRAMGF